MTISMILLTIMAGPYLLAALLRLPAKRRHAAGLLGLGVLFTFTGVGHFIKTTEMAQMLPPQMPAPVPLVYLTGVLEIAVAVALVVPRWRQALGWLLVAMLVGFLPVNIYAAMHHVPIGGHAWGPIYLALRIPLQLAMVAWVVIFTQCRPALKD